MFKILYWSRLLILSAIFITIPFEYWERIYIFGVGPAKYFGFIYFVLALTTLSNKIIFNKSESIIVYPLALLCWLLLVELVMNNSYNYNIEFYFQFLYLIMFFFFISNEIRINPRVKPLLFLSFIIGILITSLMVLAGYGIQLNVEGDVSSDLDGVDRVWFFGLNPNALGNYAALAIFFVIFLYNEHVASTLSKVVLLALIPIFGMLLMYSGSAGAVLSLIAGLAIYFIFNKTTALGRVKLYILLLLLSFILLEYIFSSEYLSDKLQRFIYEGDTTGRTEIWGYALEIFYNNPLIGVGRVATQQELYLATSMFTTAHNVYLDVLMWGGVIGLAIFSLFWIRLFRVSYNYFRTTGYSSSLVIFSVVVVLSLKSGGGFTSKIVWFFLPLINYVPVYGQILPKKR